jgi:tetratricopeptide (TPR) repeat protein
VQQLGATTTLRRWQNNSGIGMTAADHPGVAELLAAGRVHHRAGRLAQAEIDYRRILAAVPDHADALHLLGIIASQVGRHDVAIDLIDRALRQNSSDPSYHSSRGFALQGLKRQNEAVASYDRALVLKPDNAQVLVNRGLALEELKRWFEALESYDRALALAPNYVAALLNRANALHALGRFAEALECYDRALVLRPDEAAALNNRGLTLHQLTRFDEALDSYERALALRPDYAAALNNRGNTLQALRRPAEALQNYDRALALQPDYGEAVVNRGNTLQSLQRFAEALESYDRALALQPDFAEALSNRGNTLQALERIAEALESYERALAVNPEYAEVLNNRGLALQQLKRFDEALESYDRALAVNPDYVECQFNRGTLLLLIGHFAEGWQAYEWRRKLAKSTAHLRSGPEWRKGEPVARRLLLYSEQGLGDTIQFSRFASLIAKQGAEVLLEVPPCLQGLLSGLEGVKVIRSGEAPPDYDAHLPLMSLPHLLGVTSETIPASVPYLFAEPTRIAGWAERLPPSPFRVGIVRHGAAVGKGRSIPLRAFAPLCRIPGLTLISLQKGEIIEQLADLPPGMRVETLGVDFDASPDAFLDSAAVMTNLDLVISCDTASAHLAGALGCPLWLVLKDVPEWRWMMDRKDSPWYPTARLFRQTHCGDWIEVFERIAAELARAAAAKKA